MHVIHISQPVDGGVPRIVKAMANDQISRGLTVTMISPESSWYLEGLDVAVQHVPWSPPRAKLAAVNPLNVAALSATLRDLRPDIVHLHSSVAGSLGRLAIRGRIRTIVQPHAWSFRALGTPWAGLARAQERRFARWTHLYLGDGRDELGELDVLRIGTPRRSVGTGIELAIFNPIGRQAARNGVTAMLGLDDGIGLVVVVGRICEQKGQMPLVEEFVRTSPEGIALVLVGVGPDADRVRGLLYDHPGARVIMPGVTVTPELWFKAADVVVQPSLWEGASIATKEALACGAALVTTDVEGMRSVLTSDHAGVQGLAGVVEQDIGGVLRSAIHLVADAKERLRLGDAAAALAAERYSLADVHDRVFRAYEDLLEEGVPW